MLILAEADRVKDKELQLRPEVAGSRNARALQVALGLLRNESWVARIRLTENRIEYITDHR